MRDCAVGDSRAVYGGAVAVGGFGSTAIERCSIVGNQAAVGGGGIYWSSSGPLLIAECTISGNQTTGTPAIDGGGGGMFLGGITSGVVIRNSTISGNTAANGYPGGGLGLSFYGTLTIANSTITGNTTTGSGGGVGVTGGYHGGFGMLNLDSTIIAGNSAGYAPDLHHFANGLILVSGNNNLVGVADAGYFTLTGTGNRTGTAAAPLNPLLAPLADNGGPTRTHALLPGSPALNAGNNALGLTTDQRGPGFVRVSGGVADIGAFEAQPSTPRVQAIVINGGAVQRSRVTDLTVTFTTQVTFAGAVANAFMLTRVGGGAVGGFTAAAAVVGGVTVVAVGGFTGAETQFGSLADGRYTLTALASRISAGGVALDGNGDGTPGDDYTFGDPDGLFRYFGDVNGDRVVNGLDFAAFRPAFGTSAGDPAYLAALDFDGDGAINGLDFAQFRPRFGLSLP
jgi:hypothetical protein